MINQSRVFVFPVIVFLFASLRLTSSVSAQEEKISEAEKLFALQVQPVFQAKCLACHGEKPEEIEGGFDIRSRDSVLAGGDSFGAELMVPGKSGQGHLLRIVSRKEEGYEMPPKEADRLSIDETEAIRKWIDGGAPWPTPERTRQIYKAYAEGTPWKTSGGLNDDWTNRKYKTKDLWAYQPLAKKPTADSIPPDANPIDFFIDRKLKTKGIRPAPLANRRTLIRRATFDLWGLPPSPKQIKEFVEDPSDDDSAFEKLVDRLLASPHYGEQWGRHWLDVVRYADSSGFANDWIRPNAWRYRDYVVRSLNQDKPYDQFILEQLAGDELAEQLENPDPRDNPRAAELHIATGFLRMGPWEHTGMSVARVTRQQFLDDITDTVGQVFLAHALQCCKCHDHKFDPIPTRDYYSIQAVFANTQFAEIDTVWLPGENRNGMKEERQYKEKKIAANQLLAKEIEDKNRTYIKDWFKEKGLPYSTVAEAKKAKINNELLPPFKYKWTANDFGRERVMRKWSKRLPWELDAFRPIAYSVYNGKTIVKNSNQGRLKKPANVNGPGYWQNTSVLIGGSLDSPGDKVEPGVLSALDLKTQLPRSFDGRRLAFAKWLTQDSNPIVPRVMVNRIWQYHFGRGIAGNANNFGATGKPPTHPLLLDWLAGGFQSNGWSLKKLHKQIMLSQTYRRSIQHENPDQLATMDPDNELYAVFEQRHLSAEEIRDAMLSASGELNRQIGGIPARPDMNLEAALQPRLIMGTFAPSYTPHPQPEQRNRRSLYVLKLRGQRDPFFELFNQPGPDKSCEMRDQSMVTPQALTLLNGQETNDRALAMAVRVLKESESNEQAIQSIYQLAFGRPATPKEINEALVAWNRLTRIEEAIEYELIKLPTSVTRTANEENTGEFFTFVEELFEFRDYVADLQPHQVDARTRGLAGICLAVINSNEFMFID